MSPPAKELEILIRTGRLKFDGDPVLRWALQNVELRTDPAGNIKPDKQKSAGKIDPIVALCMAIGERMKRNAQPQITDDMLTIVSL
jgi:phage terminase large subunit-like protein